LIKFYELTTNTFEKFVLNIDIKNFHDKDLKKKIPYTEKTHTTHAEHHFSDKMKKRTKKNQDHHQTEKQDLNLVLINLSSRL
jgi:hypothetical protein